MPPNKGGKRYKKGKRGGETSTEMFDINESDGQMIGRVLKSVGDRRFTVYCNDNKERLCRIRGKVRKNTWIEKGAIVLLSRRLLDAPLSELPAPLPEKVVEDTDDESVDTVTNGAPDVDDKLGDILRLIDPTLYSKVKKLPGVNRLLFENVEVMEDKDIQRQLDKISRGVDDEDGFIFTNDVDEEPEKEDQEGEAKEPVNQLTKEEMKLKKKDTDVKRNEARVKKHISLDEL
jgi:initiation factor 1A